MAGRLRAAWRFFRTPFDRRHALRRLAAFHARPRPLEETARVALDLGTRGRFRVRAVQRRGELVALGAVLAALRPRTLLEIGTARGGDAFFLRPVRGRMSDHCGSP